MGILDSMFNRAYDRWLASRDRRGLAANYRGSLRREIQRCIEQSHSIVRDEKGVIISSPAYRLPTNAYQYWLDKQDLLDLDDAELATIEDFYEIVAQINGSLDAAANGYTAERFEVVVLEGARNRSKALQLIELGQKAKTLLQGSSVSTDK